VAKVKYKIEEAKKDKTISFRVPNQFYNLLKWLSQRHKEGINTYTRKLLMDYLYSRYPETEEDLKILRKERSELEKIREETFQELSTIERDIVISQAKIEENERLGAEQNKIRLDADNRIKFIDNKIRQFEDMKGK